MSAALHNPFPGLRPFEAHETHLFFGRDGQCSDIVARLDKRRFVGVVGTSGSGKSSLVRAGLLPMLEGGFMASAGSFWRFAVMRPGVDAIHSLAEALADPAVLGGDSVDPALRTPLLEAVMRRSALGVIDAYKQARLAPNENLLIVADQFEELFRFSQPQRPGDATDTAAAFVNLLLEAARQRSLPIYVVLTMRSDFLGDCARFRDLPEMLNDGQYLIPRLTRDSKRATIEGPIAVSGATIAPRLTQRLLNDAGDDPDALPVMQHALMRTWDQWMAAGHPDQPMDLEHYQAIGGMAEGLSQHAGQAYDSLAATPGAQAAARSLFRGLCERGADYRETRRPATMAQLCNVAGTGMGLMTQVVDAFRRDGRTFIVPGWPRPLRPETMLDISHESLIRQWQMLRDWVQGEARSAALYQRLRQTAQLWPQNAALWRNPDLDRALLWEREEAPTAAWAARYGTLEEFARAQEFLRASEAAWRDEAERSAQEARDATERQLQARSQRETEARLQAEVGELRSRKRLLQAVWVLVPALLAGMGWAFYNQRLAAEQALLASQAEASARKAAAIASDEALKAKLARDESVRLLEKLTNSNQLKQAFLTGDVVTIRRLAEATVDDPALRFATRKELKAWKTPDGKPISQWDLLPAPEILPSLLRSATQVSYYMAHASFNVKLLSAGAGSGFKASYTGWGCLSVVYVLVEYIDADKPPRLLQFNQCNSLVE